MTVLNDEILRSLCKLQNGKKGRTTNFRMAECGESGKFQNGRCGNDGV